MFSFLATFSFWGQGVWYIRQRGSGLGSDRDRQGHGLGQGQNEGDGGQRGLLVSWSIGEGEHFPCLVERNRL